MADRSHRARQAGMALLLASGAAAAQAAPEPTLESEVKAAFLYKFAPFVDWPPPALDAPVFTVCAAEGEPMASLLENASSGRRVRQLPVQFRRLAPDERPDGCQILFVGRPDDPAQSATLDAAGAAPVLTVTDGGDTARRRGIVHFTLRDNRVRFWIDGKAATHSGLHISSKLMSLALPGQED